MLTGPSGQCWWVRWACATGGGGNNGKIGIERVAEKGQPALSSRPWDQGSSIGRSSKKSQTLLFNSNQFSENKTKQILRVWNKTYLWVKPSPCLLTPQWAAFKKSLFKIVIYSYNGTLYSNENEWTLAIKNMDESHKSKPDTNNYSLYSMSIKFDHRPK